MSNYLLLRNNRESGPFSLDNLVQMGLKPYDLIWVDGKSAAWRYPSEIPELKPYAPVLEEQPFDRFFKKPEPVAAPLVPEIAAGPGRAQQLQAPAFAEPAAPSFSEYESRYIPQTAPSKTQQPRRAVFVTMPKGQPAAEPARQTPAAAPQPLRETKAAPATRIEEAAELETKYAQPLDDIKEMYVRTLQQRNQRASKEHVLKTYGRRAAVVVGLLGAGLLLGFIVLKKPASDKMPVSMAQPAEIQQVLALNDNIADTAPEEKMPPDAADQSLIQDLNTGHRPVSAGRLQKPDPGIVYKDPSTEPVPDNEGKRKANTHAPKETAPQQSPNYGYEPSAHNSATGERARAVRDERNEENKSNQVKNDIPLKQETLAVSRIPERLAGQLKVNSNDYKRVALGGIRDLRLTVTNESAAALAKVVVELQYLKPNEEPLKTEMVSFRGIGPNESSTIRLPDTNRGIKVKYKIVEVVE